jgi:hypothetical protein
MCKGIHNFWGEDRLSEISCLRVFEQFRIFVGNLSSIVFGVPSDFLTPNIGAHRGLSR